MPDAHPPEIHERIVEELRDLQREHEDTRRLLSEIVGVSKDVRDYLKRLTDLEAAREARVGLVRTLIERLTEPKALEQVQGIVRWMAIGAVASAAIVYGVQLSGYGFTIGTSAEVIPTVEGRPAPNPGEPRPSP